MTRLESIDLNLLRMLHFVMAEGGVRQAAERLCVTSAAVSNGLARLRLILGDPLLVKSGRTLRPTPYALELAPLLREMIEKVSLALIARTFDMSVCDRTFGLAATDNLAFEVLPAIVERLTASMPRARLRVVSLDHAIATDALASGDVDVLLALPPVLPSELRAAPAYKEEMVCVMARWCAPPSRRLSLKTFLAREHIEVALQGRHAIDYVEQALGDRSRDRKVALSVPTFLMAGLCAAATPYIATIPRRLALFLADAKDLEVMRLPFAVPPVNLKQVWHIRTDADPACIEFRKVIAAAGATSPTSPNSRSQRIDQPGC